MFESFLTTSSAKILLIMGNKLHTRYRSMNWRSPQINVMIFANLFLNHLDQSSKNYVFGHSFLIINGRMISGSLGESAWHSLHSDIIIAYFLIIRPKFLIVLHIMIPKCLLLICYRQWRIMRKHLTLMGH